MMSLGVRALLLSTKKLKVLSLFPYILFKKSCPFCVSPHQVIWVRARLAESEQGEQSGHKTWTWFGLRGSEKARRNIFWVGGHKFSEHTSWKGRNTPWSSRWAFGAQSSGTLANLGDGKWWAQEHVLSFMVKKGCVPFPLLPHTHNVIGGKGSGAVAPWFR